MNVDDDQEWRLLWSTKLSLENALEDMEKLGFTGTSGSYHFGRVKDALDFVEECLSEFDEELEDEQSPST